ncbi:MAG: preprotein translocase subunit SecA, partial [Fimbriimonadaceae bacterium]|nr:preprotein translocase subunit SecA [Chitinophagales bacterium]
MNLLTKTLSNLFGGSKHEKDVKAIEPLVGKINAEFAKLSSLSHDELRSKTHEFKIRIKEHLKSIDAEIAKLKAEGEAFDIDDIGEKDAIYKKIDVEIKDRDKEIEKILFEILTEAFAVFKETAKSFSENGEIIVTANQLDRDLSVTKDFVTIEEDKAT